MHKVRAPPVATLFCTYTHIPFDFIASFLWAPPVATQFSVVRAPQVASHRFSGRRLWRLSFLSCHRIHTYLAHNDLIRKTLDLPGSFWLEPENTSVHTYISGANALVHCSLITWPLRSLGTLPTARLCWSWSARPCPTRTRAAQSDLLTRHGIIDW